MCQTEPSQSFSICRSMWIKNILYIARGLYDRAGFGAKGGHFNWRFSGLGWFMFNLTGLQSQMTNQLPWKMSLPSVVNPMELSAWIERGFLKKERVFRDQKSPLAFCDDFLYEWPSLLHVYVGVLLCGRALSVSYKYFSSWLQATSEPFNCADWSITAWSFIQPGLTSVHVQ